MAIKQLELALRIKALVDGGASVTQLDAELRKLIADAKTPIHDPTEQVASGAKKTKGELSGIEAAANQAKLAIGGIATAATIKQIIDMAEGYGQLKARLNLAVEGLGDAGQALTDVESIANKTGQSMAAVSELYIKTAGAAKTLRISQQDVADVTEAMAKGMRVAGAEGQTAAGAMLQFSQAMGSGVFRGQEFNAVYEAAPYLIDQIAKGMGVATDEMRNLADAGALSAKEVAAALVKQSADISAAYDALPQTVGQALQRVANSVTIYLAEANEAAGVTSTLAEAISSLAEHVDLLGPAAAAVAAGGLAKMTQAGIAAVANLKDEVALRLAQREALAQEVAARKVSTAQSAAQAVAERQAAQSAAEAAAVRKVAAAQQLADMKQLAIYGGARAAAERELAAANTLVAETELALAAATERAAIAMRASTAAMAGTAAGAAILSRALSFLSGPGGIILATVATFAAFSASADDAGESAGELADRLDGVRSAIDRMDVRKAHNALKDLEDELRSLKEESKPGLFNFDPQGRTETILKIGELNRTINALKARLREQQEEQSRGAQSTTALVKGLHELSAAEETAGKAAAAAIQAQASAATAYSARAAALGNEAEALRAHADALDLTAAARDAELAAAQRQAALLREEFALLKARDGAKQSELDKMAQAVVAAEAEATAKRTAAEATRQEAELSRLAAGAYGDQSAQVGALVAEKDRLTVAIRQAGETSAEAAPLLDELAAVNFLLADAAKDAADNIDLQIQANQRSLTNDQARLALMEDESKYLEARAKRRGDDVAAAYRAIDAERAAEKALVLAADAKERDAALMAEKARLTEEAARATGDFTEKERQQVDAMRDAAELALTEAERMRINARTKREATDETRRLVEQQELLRNAMAGVGVEGVESIGDLRNAIQNAATGPELDALAQGLRDAIAAGTDETGRLSQALDEVLKKSDALANRHTRTAQGYTMETIYNKWGRDIGAYEREAFGSNIRMENPTLVKSYVDAYRQWLDANHPKEPDSAATKGTTVTRRVVDINLRAGSESAALTGIGEDEAERVVRVLQAAQKGTI